MLKVTKEILGQLEIQALKVLKVLKVIKETQVQLEIKVL